MGLARQFELFQAKREREGLVNAVSKSLEIMKGDRLAHDFASQNPDPCTFADVLFINGCDYAVPHPIRYRVDHQIQQLEAAGLSTLRINAWELNLETVCSARNFVIFRCPYTTMVGDFIKLAHQLNKRVYFDIDDLVVDTKFTDQIPFVAAMVPSDKDSYDDGVKRMGKTMELCDGLITTTEALARELAPYVPDTFINRNVASQEMVHFSDQALYERDVLPTLKSNQVQVIEQRQWRWACETDSARRAAGLVLGYFSGSITHNSDFEMILPAIVKVMRERPNTRLSVVGELDVPKELEEFRDRITFSPFCEWRDLPRLIASVDINLAPLTDTVFNEAKSENKWVEAALVKVPTIASNIGSFATMIRNHETGVLCSTPYEWYREISHLLDDADERVRLGEAAFTWCRSNATTAGTGQALARYITKHQTKNIVFVLPSLNTSGGVLVGLRHAVFLQRAGYDVTLVDNDRGSKETLQKINGCTLPVCFIKSNRNRDEKYTMRGRIDLGVATFFDTLWSLLGYSHINRIGYLVQNYETDFFLPGDVSRIACEATYNQDNVEYLTISKWCQNWLYEKYGHEARFAPNGIDKASFPETERDFTGKIRILVEGDSTFEYKNVDEAFKIINLLDSAKYEIWYMSYNGKPKETYRVDKFLHAVPHDEVGKVYGACHILLKTSILESFSYPPLEMMATGGWTVVLPNGGNAEYIEDGANCLTYERGDLKHAADQIERIVNDGALRVVLREGGLSTARSRDWSLIRDDVLRLYE